ncbi:MAG: hypothetical protein RLZZ65_831 [Bacteroidota bacterium]|jgi:UPF0755 protein
MSRKQKLILIASIVSIAIVALALPQLRYYYAAFQKSDNTNAVTIFIPSKTEMLNVEAIAKLLQEKGVLQDPSAFQLVGENKDMNPRNIAPGKYIIEPGTALRHIWNGFKMNSNQNGNAEQTVKVSFENCRSLNDLAGKLQQQLESDSAAFMAAFQDGAILSKLGFTYEQLPALFIPNTYEMYWDQKPQAFIDLMAKSFKDFWTPARMAKLKEVGLNAPSEAVTLASIVYSEQSKNAQEWPIIAGLYLNRIKQGIKLQSDPTFKFCWGDKLKGVQRLLAVHRDVDCPYNTYKIQGLPPGPIYLPPIGVVDAVLNPTKHNYIFMCAKPDYTGTHNFTASGSEHTQNAQIFQRWLGDELKKR